MSVDLMDSGLDIGCVVNDPVCLVILLSISLILTLISLCVTGLIAHSNIGFWSLKCHCLIGFGLCGSSKASMVKKYWYLKLFFKLWVGSLETANQQQHNNLVEKRVKMDQYWARYGFLSILESMSIQFPWINLCAILSKILVHVRINQFYFHGIDA